MRRALTLLSLCASTAPACVFHRHVDANAPGHVSLDAPPAAGSPVPAKHSDPEAAPVAAAPSGVPDLTATAVETPRDPGEQGTIVGVSFHGGWANAPLDGGRRNAGHLQLEATLLPFELESTHRGWVTPKVLPASTRLALGLGLRMFDGQGGPTVVRAAPVYVEVQHTRLDEIWGATFGLGLGFAPHTPRGLGPQASLCVGIPLLATLCGRGSYLFGQGPEVMVTLGYHGYVESIGSR